MLSKDLSFLIASLTVCPRHTCTSEILPVNMCLSTEIRFLTVTTNCCLTIAQVRQKQTNKPCTGNIEKPLLGFLGQGKIKRNIYIELIFFHWQTQYISLLHSNLPQNFAPFHRPALSWVLPSSRKTRNGKILPDGTEETREQLQNCQEENGQQN